MGVVEEHASVLSQEQFEELARLGVRVDEALRLERINGKIGEKALPDPVGIDLDTEPLKGWAH
ncbi:hypothetical protein [Streptomyces sp. NPDC018045]|uniref:hypothetical protein n=1 Tax=Streptomyces sp. NPDC018045 TaxID=3365037 RepID=UPI0037BC0C0A